MIETLCRIIKPVYGINEIEREKQGSALSSRACVANVKLLCGRVFCNRSRRNREPSRICVFKITQTIKRKVRSKYSRIVENSNPASGVVC